MALSHCMKCGNYKFELADSHLKQHGSKVVFVQCSTCGCVVGALELRAAEKWLEEQEKQITPVHEQAKFEL